MTHVRVDWDAAAGLGGVIRRSTGGAPGEVIAVVADTTTYDDHDVVPGQTYAYTVSSAEQGVEGPPTAPASIAIPGGGSPDADFVARRTAPGVVRWWDFDSDAAPYGTQLGNYGTPYNCGITGVPAGGVGVGPSANWVIARDTSVKASGAASLRFDCMANADGDVGLGWFGNFSTDLSRLFGAGETFYIQWRQRFNRAFVDTIILQGDGVTPQGGIKQCIISAGDEPGWAYHPSANEPFEIVVQTDPYAQKKIPTIYHHLEGTETTVAPLFEPHGASDYYFQNVTPFRCDWGAPRGAPSCFAWVADEWMTFKVMLAPGPYLNNAFVNNKIKMWVGREGQSLQQVLDWDNTKSDYSNIPNFLGQGPPGPPPRAMRYGKLWLTPFMTGLGQYAHPTFSTWYDEVIISTQDIADPGAEKPAAPGNPVFAALPPNTLHALGNYVCSNTAGGQACQRVGEYSSILYDGKRNQAVSFGGGHSGTDYNAVNCFSMDTLTWAEHYPPTPVSLMTTGNWDTRGFWTAGPKIPCALARHVEDTSVIVGDEMWLLTWVDGNSDSIPSAPGNTLAFKSEGTARVLAYNLDTKAWRVTAMPSMFPTIGGAGSWPGSCLDPVTDKVVQVGPAGIVVFDPVAETRTLVVNYGATGVFDDGGVSVSPPQDNCSLVYNSFESTAATGMFYHVSPVGRVVRVAFNRANPAASVTTKLTISGNYPLAVFPSFNFGSNEAGYDYDSKNNRIGGGIINNTFFTFDCAAKAWRSATMLGGSAGNLQYQCICYDPPNNVFVFTTSAGSGHKTWAYRHA